MSRISKFENALPWHFSNTKKAKNAIKIFISFFFDDIFNKNNYKTYRWGSVES